MPRHYINFDDLRRKEDIRQGLVREFKTHLLQYAAPLGQSFCNDGEVCKMAKVIMGGFNICVELEIRSSDGGLLRRWILRVPIPALHGDGLLDEKFRSEVATIKYISMHTTIPLAPLVAYGLKGGLHLGGDYFMIMGFVDADMLALDVGGVTKLSEENTEIFYSSLADILLQLWSCQFDGIGSISLRDDGTPDCQNLTRPLALDLNNLVLDGVDLSAAMPRDRSFRTATEYFYSMADLHMKHLLDQRNAIEADEAPGQKIINRWGFKSCIPQYTDDRWDRGPFVLIFGDLTPQNIMVDKSGKIVAILDLEWTSVRPLQCVGPPVWLSGFHCGDLIVRNSDRREAFTHQFDTFTRIFRRRETEYLQRHPSAFFNYRPSDIITSSLSSKRFWFAEAMLSFYGFDGLAFEILEPCVYQPDGMTQMISEWVGREKVGILASNP